MHTALIEKLAHLRGIADAYHNYRGELHAFSLQTKIGILSAMGCAVDDEDEVTANLAQFEAAQWRKFLPVVATARGAWVKSGVKYSENSVLLRVNSDGSRSLIEIRLAGTAKSIVLKDTETVLRVTEK